MTTVVLLADPPRPGLRFPDLAATSPLNESEVAELAGAIDRDAMRAIERSGADLLVNYRPEDLLDEAHRTEVSPEAEIRALAADAVSDVGEVRFEPQVGSTPSARVGNTVTHLLREEGARSVAVLPGTTPFITRAGIDSAAMKHRSNDVVLGPGPGGSVYYAGFSDTVDFTDAMTPPALNTIAELARGEDHETAFLPTQPTVRTGDELASVVAELRARVAAGRAVPDFTAALIEEYGLIVDEDGLTRQ
ncbi:hypothetical protein SY89_02595 [Halolamina pelagica]|uniref:DUF2064 domain-containing protein n=1 Tax=Halolamina pelagica TaxID=699431 RepID=A0A0P7HDU5_9EURY|nr:hypothetical protein [Halolamina pelagica]KPN31840.1 hypothetical protein SY89_02595 [Halolamina pelagica]